MFPKKRLKKRPSLHRAIHLRCARLAVSSSTVRGREAGLADDLRSALSHVRLSSFGVSGQKRFLAALDRWTERIQEAVGLGRCSWGLARKCLNIFLRDCYYNAFLKFEFGSKVSPDWFEVPLDSISGRRLHELEPEIAPAWRKIGDIDAESNQRFQAAALQVSRKWNLDRVHLDTHFWVLERPE